MQKILLVGFYVLTTTFFSVTAQNDLQADITWGEKVSLGKKETGPDPVGVLGSSFYAINTKFSLFFGTKRTLEVYDLSGLSLQAEYEIELKYNKFDLALLNYFIFGDEMVVITSYRDTKAKEKYYLVHRLSKQGELGEPVVLATLPIASNKMFGKRKQLDQRELSGEFSFSYIISEDKSNILVSFLEPREADEKAKMQAVHFNANLEEQNRGSYEIPFDNFESTAARFTNAGKLYIIGYEFEESEEKKGIFKRKVTETTGYNYLVFDVVENTLAVESFDIDKEISSMGIKVFEDGRSIIYGMYSNEGGNKISGAFFISFDKNQEELFESLEEFEVDFVTQNWTEQQVEKAEKKKEKQERKGQEVAEPSLYSYIIHDLVMKDNGEMTMLAEQYYMYITQRTSYNATTGQSTTTYTYHYIYNDILAVNCTPEGEITWKENIKKRQHTTNDDGQMSSFFTITQNNNIYLIYNERQVVLEEEEGEEKTSPTPKRLFSGSKYRYDVAAIIAIGEEGGSTRKTLMEMEDDDSRILVPKRCEKIGDDKIFLYSKAGRRAIYLGWLKL